MTTTQQPLAAAPAASLAAPVPATLPTTPAPVPQKAAPAKRAKAPTRKTSSKIIPVKKPVVKTPVAKKAIAKKAIGKPLVPQKPVVKAPVSKAVLPSKTGKTAELHKAKKDKLVRDSFTIPKAEYAVLGELKERAAILGRPVKKTELLRAGIKILAALSNAALLTALTQVPIIKTGRPTLKSK